MKTIIYLMGLCILISCDNEVAFPSIERTKWVQSAHKAFDEPQVYFSQKGQLVKISEVNRKNALLKLSDQIIFSDIELPDTNKLPDTNEKDALLPLDKLENFEKDEDLKIKVSSFCSYINQELEQKPNHRVFQEMGSGSYHWSFSIFELLPQEILLNGLDENFYCSFVFAFKDTEGAFNHYNIAQQIIEPSFQGQSPNQLLLVRTTEQGHYLPVGGNEAIKPKYIYKIFLLNKTNQPVKSYQLFCEGLEVSTISNAASNAIPVFVNLIEYEWEKWSEGEKKCRFFSKNNKKITGMTDSFQLDFKNLKNKTTPVDLTKIDEPVVMAHSNKPISSGRKIPLNSYFYFNNFHEIHRSDQDYRFIEIQVKTKCFNNKVFGKGKVVSEIYRFPFREKFPVMAVTPKPAFIMDTMTHSRWLSQQEKFLREEDAEKQHFRLVTRRRDAYTTTCLYEMRLENQHDLKDIKEFKSRFYLVHWSSDSYGMDYIPLGPYESISPFVIEDTKTSLKRRQFLRLRDVHQDKAGYLSLSFFDMIDDPLFQIEDYKANQIRLECYSGKDKDGNSDSIEVSWPYHLQNNPISLKAVFLKTNVIHYIKRKTVAVCRLIIYEDDILRYFSGEMKITE